MIDPSLKNFVFPFWIILYKDLLVYYLKFGDLLKAHLSKEKCVIFSTFSLPKQSKISFLEMTKQRHSMWQMAVPALDRG